jgi:hypothetical protein
MKPKNMARSEVVYLGKIESHGVFAFCCYSKILEDRYFIN